MDKTTELVLFDWVKTVIKIGFDFNLMPSQSLAIWERTLNDMETPEGKEEFRKACRDTIKSMNELNAVVRGVDLPLDE